MTKLDEIREKIKRWREEYPHLIQPEREHTANIAQFELLLAIVERQREALEKLREHHKAWINGARADVIYERMDKEFECIAEVEKLINETTENL